MTRFESPYRLELIGEKPGGAKWASHYYSRDESGERVREPVKPPRIQTKGRLSFIMDSWPFRLYKIFRAIKPPGPFLCLNWYRIGKEAEP